LIKWDLKNIDTAKEISYKLNISFPTALFLISRGLKTIQEIKKFLYPDFLKEHSNPFLLPDIQKAIERIKQALEKGEKILIYGDKDVDGITAIAILYYTLKLLGNIPYYYVPSDESYGLSEEIIDKYIKQGIKLIITVDCGITSKNEVKYAKQNGIDVIITDHHEVQSKLLPEDAICIINPKLKESKYPFKEIAGCMVSYKLAHALIFSYDKLYNKNIVIIDIETTGLNPATDEILEISALKINNFVIIDEFYTLVKPKNKIPQEITKIHGITDENCSEAPDIKEILPELYKFIGDSIIVCHNASFDIGFLNYFYRFYYSLEIKNEIIDTLKLARETLSQKSYSLESLYKNLELPPIQHHRAKNDTYAIFRIFQYLIQLNSTNINFFLQENIDLVTIGTIADLMPLVEENRALVKFGLENLTSTKKIGLKTLFDEFLNFEEKITSKNISFSIVPVLNSCGRLNKANISLELLITEDKNKAEKIIDEIYEINQQRKEFQDIALQKYKELFMQQVDENDKIIFLYYQQTIDEPEIPSGVIGPVANYFVNKYKLPTIIIKDNIGACRSSDEFDMHFLLTECSDLLINFGGHKYACGFTIEKNKIKNFRERIFNVIKNFEYIKPELEINGIISFEDLTEQFFNELEFLEPFGMNNPYPVFLLKKLKIDRYLTAGVIEENIKIPIYINNKVIYITGYNLREKIERILRLTSTVDLIVRIEPYNKLIILDVI